MLKHLIPLIFAAIRFAPDGEGEGGGGTGAMPGTGATPGQASQTGATAGAMPAGAAAKDAATAAKPATGDAALGEAGKAALTAERDARQRAETELNTVRAQLEELQSGSQTEHERAIAAAAREAAATERTKWQSRIREAEVRGALRGAGLTNEKLIGLAVAAPEFRELKVDNETGAVEGVTAAIERFRTDYPEAFGAKAAAASGGSWGGSEGGSTAAKPETMQDAVMDRLAKANT